MDYRISISWTWNFPIYITLLQLLSAAAGGWQVVHQQSPDAAGTPAYPSIRYGHACESYRGNLLLTHGYYYDRQHSLATWLSDSWTMNAADGSYIWQRVSDHLPQSIAYDAYSRGQHPSAPCGRFGHVSAVIDNALFLYGGSDGGYSRTNRQDYKPGNDFDDFWRFDLINRTWSLLRPIGGNRPGKRHMAGAAAVQGRFILYGGIGPKRGDVWSYDPLQNFWELLSEAVPVDHDGPGARIGHSMLPWLTGQVIGVLVYGGQSQISNGSYIVHNDAWFFDLPTRHWRKLEPSTAAEAGSGNGGEPPLAPSGHFYQAAMVTSLTLPPTALAAAAAAVGDTDACQTSGGGGDAAASPDCHPHHRKPTHAVGPVRLRVGVVAGGSTTTPGLTCSNQAWAFTTDCAATHITWARLPDLPAAVYDTRGAAVGGAAYVFGGHLCYLEHPLRPAPYPYYYVNEALRLDLGLGLDENLDLKLDLGVGFKSGAVAPRRGIAPLLRGGVGAVGGTAACAMRLHDGSGARVAAEGRRRLDAAAAGTASAWDAEWSPVPGEVANEEL